MSDGSNQLAPNTLNEWLIGTGTNLPNHTSSIAGRGSFVRQSRPEIPTFRTKQEAYRYAAWLITLAELHLPDESPTETYAFDEVLVAVRNT